MQIMKRDAPGYFLSVSFVCLSALAITIGTQAQSAPKYKVDPFWPKPLPNKWIMQQVPDLYVDKDDYIWVLNRSNQIKPDENGASTTPPRTDCCIEGPTVLEFDTHGNLLKGWGGPNYVPGWPGLQTIMADKEGNVWISGMGRGDSIIKLTADGKLLWDFGHRGPAGGANEGPVKQNNQQTDIFPSGVAGFDLDEEAREIYIADGFVNKRILVYDMDTGAFKRGWGGHGMPLSEIDNDPVPPYDTSGPAPDIKGFATPIHCVHLSRDGFVYVCERGSDRVQVFTKQGQFVSSFFVHPSTPARGKECGGPGSTMYGPCGTIFNLTFSPAPEQKYLFVADGTNDKIWIIDRKKGTTEGSIGDNGRMAGQFHWVDGIGADSQGNIYTGEVETGKRIQKFVPAKNKSSH